MNEQARQEASLRRGRTGTHVRYQLVSRRLVELDPTNAHYEFHIGVSLHQRRRIRESIAHYERAVELGPTEPVARLNLASVYKLTFQYDECREQLEEALRLEDSALKRPGILVRILSGLAAIRGLQGDDFGAVACLRRAARLDPNDMDTVHVLTVLTTRLARTDPAQREEALGLLRRAASVNPGHKLMTRTMTVLAAEGMVRDVIPIALRASASTSLAERDRRVLRLRALYMMRQDYNKFRGALAAADPSSKAVRARFRDYLEHEDFRAVHEAQLERVPATERKRWKTLFAAIRAALAK